MYFVNIDGRAVLKYKYIGLYQDCAKGKNIQKEAKKEEEQAGAELCQARSKLGLAQPVLKVDN
jgi:hypothetical protein